MGDTTQQASGTPEAEAAKGNQSETTQTSSQTEADADRKQQPSAEEAATKKLNDRLAEQGRQTKAEKARADALDAELAKERAEREKLWFTHQDTPETERDAFRKSREAAAKDAPKNAQLENRAGLAEAIAEEESPVVRKALKALQSKAKESGKYPDPSTIAAIRESLAPDGASGTKEEDETPPNVSSSRGTQSAGGPTLDEQIKVVEESVRKRDGKHTYGELLGLRQQASSLAATAARG